MAKRFTDTNKYKKPFIRSLQAPYKLLWDYLYHDCDHAGIWIVDFDIAQIYIGLDAQVNRLDSLLFFNSEETRIVEFDNGKKWFIPSFIDFQYGELNESNRAHNSVISILKKHNLIGKDNKPLISPLQGAKVKDKDKDMVKDKDKKDEFEIFWTTYHTKTDRQKTDKEPARKKWNALNKSEQKKAVEQIDNYVRSNKKEFLKKARTYLSDKSFNDEFEKPRAKSDFSQSSEDALAEYKRSVGMDA
jgi:hypothetical protein